MRHGDPGFDSHGNPVGRAFDLGSIDDERLQGERILMYVAFIGSTTKQRGLRNESVSERW
jgi:hypothetical protein